MGDGRAGWRNHLVSKVGGKWWSFFNESYCDGVDVGTKGCAWRVRSVQKTVNNTCLLNKVYTASDHKLHPPFFLRCSQNLNFRSVFATYHERTLVRDRALALGVYDPSALGAGAPNQHTSVQTTFGLQATLPLSP